MISATVIQVFHSAVKIQRTSEYQTHLVFRSWECALILNGQFLNNGLITRMVVAIIIWRPNRKLNDWPPLFFLSFYLWSGIYPYTGLEIKWLVPFSTTGPEKEWIVPFYYGSGFFQYWNVSGFWMFEFSLYNFISHNCQYFIRENIKSQKVSNWRVYSYINVATNNIFSTLQLIFAY